MELPPDFVTRLRMLYPDEYEAVLTSCSVPMTPAFRINTLKGSEAHVLSALTKDGFAYTDVRWYQHAYTLQNRSIRDLTGTDVYKQGMLYIQNLSSMVPVLVLDPKPGEKVLDIAAAPGSKTTQIAMHMKNTGELVANDSSRQRLYKLKEILKQQGVTRTTASLMHGEQLWRKYPEYFDKTLVDVPCSMEGRIKTVDPDSYKDWSERKIKDLAVKQKHLLRAAVTATKIGGTIVYSTCTLAPEENEGVIAWILEKEGHALVLESIAIPHLPLLHGITKWKGKEYNPEVSKTARILPSDSMEGFFVAKLVKNASTLPLPKMKRKFR